MKIKNTIKYILSAAAAAVLLYFSFKGVDWKSFITSLESCSWEFILMSMAFGAMSFFLRSLRWRELLLPIDPSTTKTTSFNAVNISYMVNLVLPRVGEFIRCGYITKHSKEDAEGKKLASVDKVFGTAVTDRLFDIVTLFLLTGITAILLWGKVGTFVTDSSNYTLSRVLVLLTLTAIGLSCICVVKKLSINNKWAAKLWNIIKGIWQGVKSCMEMKSWWKFIIFTLLIWTCYWMMSVSTVWAVQSLGNYNLNLGDAFFLMVIGSVSSIIPVPGGFGAFHYVVSLALSTLYGIPTEIGIIFSTLSHEPQVIIQILCGFVSWIYETIKK